MKTRSFNSVSQESNAGADNDSLSKQKVNKFAYGEESMGKKNIDAPGLLNLKTVHLPDQLQKNVQEFLKRKFLPFKILQ
mgnify:CR=1 FL=1